MDFVYTNQYPVTALHTDCFGQCRPSFLLRMWEKKMDGPGSYKLVEVDSLTMSAGTYSHPDKDAFGEKSREFKEGM